MEEKDRRCITLHLRKNVIYQCSLDAAIMLFFLEQTYPLDTWSRIDPQDLQTLTTFTPVRQTKALNELHEAGYVMVKTVRDGSSHRARWMYNGSLSEKEYEAFHGRRNRRR